MARNGGRHCDGLDLAPVSEVHGCYVERMVYEQGHDGCQ